MRVRSTPIPVAATPRGSCRRQRAAAPACRGPVSPPYVRSAQSRLRHPGDARQVALGHARTQARLSEKSGGLHAVINAAICSRWHPAYRYARGTECVARSQIPSIFGLVPIRGEPADHRSESIARTATTSSRVRTNPTLPRDRHPIYLAPTQVTAGERQGRRRTCLAHRAADRGVEGSRKLS